jgi:hypothetical protein
MPFPGYIGAAIIALSLSFGALPVHAKTVQDHLDAGYAFAQNAIEFEEDGKYQTACRYYRYARDELASAILGTATESGRLDTRGVQDQIDAIMKHMQDVCRQPDGPAPAKSTARSSQTSAGSPFAYSDLASQKEDVLRWSELAHSQYKDAAKKYEAKDFVGACASARESADNFTSLVKGMRSNPALEAQFGNPEQVYANAAQAVADRDEFYCIKRG